MKNKEKEEEKETVEKQKRRNKVRNRISNASSKERRKKETITTAEWGNNNRWEREKKTRKDLLKVTINALAVSIYQSKSQYLIVRYWCYARLYTHTSNSSFFRSALSLPPFLPFVCSMRMLVSYMYIFYIYLFIYLLLLVFLHFMRLLLLCLPPCSPCGHCL